MQKVKQFSDSAAILLDDIGGEPLMGSGFETEVAETECGTEELSPNEEMNSPEE